MICVFSFSMIAQTFAPAFQGFSRKKTTFITLKDGSEISVIVKGLKFKKGLIDELKVAPVNGKKKVKINPEDISHMYIPPSALASSEVQVKKKKTQYCMLQLMNPTFSSEIKVYNDPYSSESMSVGVGGMTVAGGLEKSYYIKKKGDKLAKKIKKKEYKQDMDMLFGECPDIISKYGANPKWSEFEMFIYDYSTMCK